MVDQRQRHRACELLDAALARVVAGDRRDRQAGVDRAHLHDRAAAALGDHLARDRLADQEAALEVDRDHRVPVGLGDFEERRGAEDAGVADQRVDATEGGQRRGQRGVDLGLGRDVAAQRPHARALRGQRLGERSGLGLGEVPQRDDRAVVDQALDAGRAYALRGAGDDDDAAGQAVADRGGGRAH